MKHQYDRKGGIILTVMGSVFVCFVLGITIGFGPFVGTGPGLLVFVPAGLMAIVGIVLFVIGIRFIIRGTQSAKIKETGRKSTCEIFNVLRVKNGYIMTVTYKSDSGAEYMQALNIDYRTAAILKPGLTIECYVQGEDCFVDASHIVVIKNDDADF